MKTKYRILILTMILSIILSLGTTASAAELFDVKDNVEIGGTYFLTAEIDGKTYLFDRNGYMQTGIARFLTTISDDSTLALDSYL